MLSFSLQLISFDLLTGTFRPTYGRKPARDDPDYLRATTACLSAIIVMQIVNVFLCKHPDRSLFRSPLIQFQ